MFEERKFYQIFKELTPIFHKLFQQTEEEHNLTHLGGQYYPLMQIRRRYSAKILNKIAKQSNRQGRLWSTKKGNRVSPRECTGHSKHPLPTPELTLHMDITR